MLYLLQFTLNNGSGNIPISAVKAGKATVRFHNNSDANEYIVRYDNIRILYKLYMIYHIAEKFGRAKVWQIYSFWVFGEKVWRMNRFSQKVIIVSRYLMVLVWWIKDDSPKFLPAKLSHYMVFLLFILCFLDVINSAVMLVVSKILVCLVYRCKLCTFPLAHKAPQG